MSRSSFPPKLRKFVKSVEKNARSAGRSVAHARIFGAWSACFVRFCTVHDRDWRDPAHVPPFLKYLQHRQEVDDGSLDRVAESMAFLFGELLKADVRTAPWHPDRRTQARTTQETSAADASAEADEKGEQSTLLTRLLFHTSLPINEALELCAGDVDLEAGLIYVSDAMGTPKQIIELPETLRDPLRRHLRRLRREHGPRYFDAPLFQARALQGRGSRANDVDKDRDDSQEETMAADGPDESASSERPASLWGYASDT